MTTAPRAHIDIDSIRATRRRHPAAIVEAAVARQRRSRGERVMLVAADHPARGALARGDDPVAMADRGDLLQRLVTALARPGVDGVLATADILEDLLLLGVLDDKLVIGSMNRGGLAGAAFELDDRFTGYDAQTLERMGFDGGKMLTRIDLDDAATVATLEASARAVNELAERDLLALIEPFMSHRVDGRLHNDLRPDEVIRSAAIASGLGVTSRQTWLKLPVVDDMERVVRSTTLPVLLLGGDPAPPADSYFEQWRRALALPGVQGLVVGRSLLYPADDDVVGAVDTAVEMVHGEPGVR